ncbi:MAG: hypothetical protein HYW26_01775 [Candidatus Aenigmarchaeota archaeon]|nr:hypothetical protein [Candidatus Aenigmarchaeota archaeon]
MKKFLLKFIGSFPTATILYILLVLMMGVKFTVNWFLFAVIIDIIDDLVTKA